MEDGHTMMVVVVTILVELYALGMMLVLRARSSGNETSVASGAGDDEDECTWNVHRRCKRLSFVRHVTPHSIHLSIGR